MITFVDLFAGIGGFRLGLESNGFKCVFSAEINPHACEMYFKNFNDNSLCDITKLSPKNMPNFNILCAGFPCQAFSIAGKKMGFNDTRGTLFFDLCRIIENKKPDVLFLENVKNLLIHDNKKTFLTIKNILEDLGYNVFHKVLNASDYGVPQNRERTIIICTLKDSTILKNKIFDFNKIEIQKDIYLSNILEEDKNDFLNTSEYTLIENPKKQPSKLIFVGYRNKNTRTKGVLDNTIHLSRTHKQPNRIYCSTGIHPTLSSQETSGRYFILHNNKVRKLSILECYRLMGFPDNFVKPGSKSNLYNRVGNSVCVPMINAVAKAIKEQLFN